MLPLKDEPAVTGEQPLEEGEILAALCRHRRKFLQLFASGSMGWLAEKVGFEWIFLIAALACGTAFWILAVRAPFEKT